MVSVPVLVIQHAGHPAEKPEQPGGNHIKEFIIVDDHQIARPGVPQNVPGIKKPCQ